MNHIDESLPGNALSDAGISPLPPGVFLVEYLLPALGLSVADVHEYTGLAKDTVREIVNQERPVTRQIACKLALLCAELDKHYWLNLQAAVDASMQVTATG